MIRAAATAFVIWLTWAGGALAQSHEELVEAGRQFQESCMHCHQPPDLSFATDRAWLDQVNRTA